MANYPKLDLKFFRRLKGVDAQKCLVVWKTQRFHEDGGLRNWLARLLELVTERTRQTGRIYLSGEWKLVTDTVKTCDEVMKALKPRVPESLSNEFDSIFEALKVDERSRNKDGLHTDVQRRLRTHHIVLFTQLTVPSESYHFRVIQGIVREAKSHSYSVSIHETAPSGNWTMVERTIDLFKPDGALMLRLTPSRSVIRLLERRRVPTVLIHADQNEYPPPILSNVVPNQQTIGIQLRQCLEKRFKGRPKNKLKVVMVAMRDENESGSFPVQENVESRSIRNVRKLRILGAIGQYDWRTYDNLRDYGFHNAIEVWRAHPDADVFIALSDQLAVAQGHLIEASTHNKEWRRRVIGFDDSKLARSAKIASFSQGLEETGKRAVKILCSNLPFGSDDPWPEFQPTLIPVSLKRG